MRRNGNHIGIGKWQFCSRLGAIDKDQSATGAYQGDQRFEGLNDPRFIIGMLHRNQRQRDGVRIQLLGKHIGRHFALRGNRQRKGFGHTACDGRGYQRGAGVGDLP